MTNRIPVWFQGLSLIVLWWFVLGTRNWAYWQLVVGGGRGDSLSHECIILPKGMALVLSYLSLRFGWTFVATRREKSTAELVVFALAIVVSAVGGLISFGPLLAENLSETARQFR